MKTLVKDALIMLALPMFLLRHAQYFEAEWFYQQAEKQSLAQRYDQALPLYQRAAAILPERAMYQRGVARTCLKLYHPPTQDLRPLFQARKALEQLLSTEKVYPYDWYDLGEVLERLQQAGVTGLPESEDYFRRAWERDPTNPRFLAGWVSWLVRHGRREEARPRLLQLMVSEPKAIHLFGNQLLTTPQERIEFGRELDGLPEANLEYARYLFRQKELDLAAQCAEQIPAEARVRPRLALPLSELLLGLGQPAQANELLARAFAANPRNLAIIHSRAQGLARQKDFRGAVAAYQQALEASPTIWDLNLHLARMARLAGEDDLALQHYQMALAGTPNRSLEKEIHLGLAEIQDQRGDRRGALSEYEKALELSPADAKLADKVKRVRVEVKIHPRPSPPP